MTVMRRFVLLITLAIAALAALAPIAQAKVSVALHATTHNPTAGKKWPITITAKDGNKKVCGHVRYAFLFKGKVVVAPERRRRRQLLRHVQGPGHHLAQARGGDSAHVPRCRRHEERAAQPRLRGSGEALSGAPVAVDGVSKSYDGRIHALRDVSLDLEPGEFVALTGPSGSGKSTLLQLIGGLDRPDTGDVRVDDVSVPGLRHPSRFRRDVIGFVFQLHYLLPHLTAADNVELAMIGTGRSRAERADHARELLGEVGLGHRAGARPSELSGGERQRVAVARSLANEPRLLLADEPTGALDTVAGARVLDLMEAVRERRGTTMLVVSYDPAVAERAGRELHLTDGRLIAPARTAPASRPGPGG